MTPVFVPGNPTCTGLGYDAELKIDPPNAGTYDFPNGDTVTVTRVGDSFNWTSTLGIDAVLAKGGPNANLYVYDPPAESFGDTGLHSPINPENNQPYGLSHISFCYDVELEVTKTAETSFTRTYDWTIDKVGDRTEVLLSEGQTISVNYDVTVDLDETTPYTDSDWAVAGEITIDNPWDLDATITGVADVITPGPINALVDCGVSFPYVLGDGETLVCDYAADLPNADQRLNTATVTTSGPVGGDDGTADVVFGDPTTLVDDCVDVDDDKFGELGTVCVGDDLPYTFEYTLDIGPYEECGEFAFVNTATFVTDDTGTEGSDSHTVDVTVACEEGCTLTQGYWRTHSEHGPAPYDEAWLNLGPEGQDTEFFESGKSYYEVLWTPPQGNAYYILAHQYIAAELNILDGADTTSAVDAAMAAAKSLFEAQGAGDTSLSKTEASAAKSLAATLDSYNNGLIGPGHCSE